MPAVLSFPGVYIEEVPSGVRTITGVATSITAFVGRAVRGPVDSDPASPVRIASFADYERTFGGLSNDCPMSFAVAHYFNNGGADALIVRVTHGAGATPATRAFGDLTLSAANPGLWGNGVTAAVDHSDGVGGTLAAPLFNLTLVDAAASVTESVFGVSMDAASPRFVTRVLEGSVLARASVTAPAARPGITAATALAGGGDGVAITAVQVTAAGLEATRRGIFALDRADLFNILCIPPFAPGDDVEATELGGALAFCKRRRALLLVDPPAATNTVAGAITFANSLTRDENIALFFPRVRAPNPLRDNRLESFVPCGAVAGVLARTDAARGVWKSPAGLDATLNGVSELSLRLNDSDNGQLNPLGINCLREFPTFGRVVWGARTLRGADSLASEWKYLAVRRTALFLEESLYRGTQWVVFEPNDEPLWAQIRLNAGAFMQNLFRQGAFQGRTPREAYFVKCDRETTTQNDINLGIVNIYVGFAPLKPAEFVVIKLQQIAGEIAV